MWILWLSNISTSLFNPTNLKLIYLLNPYYVKFHKWKNPPSIFGTFHYHFQGNQDENLKLVSQQYRAWSDCMDVQASLALNQWQRLITFSSSLTCPRRVIPFEPSTKEPLNYYSKVPLLRPLKIKTTLTIKTTCFSRKMQFSI